MKKSRIYAVHYGKNTDTTRRFVLSLTPFLGTYRDLVIINNSKEVDLEMLKGEYISIVSPGKNLGYFGAVKFGTDRFPHEEMDYIIVCNNDIEIVTPGFFEIVEEKLAKWDIIAPSTKTPEGIEQNPHRESQPSLTRKLYYRLYFTNYFLAWLFDKAYTIRKTTLKKIHGEAVEHAIFSPHGACIIISSAYFKKGGYIEDGSFLYGEEDTIAAIALRNNIKIGFVPLLKVLHLESQATGKGLPRKKYQYQKTAYQFILKNYPWLYKS